MLQHHDQLKYSRPSTVGVVRDGGTLLEQCLGYLFHAAMPFHPNHLIGWPSPAVDSASQGAHENALASKTA